MGRQRTATTLSFNTEKDKGKFLSVGENGWLEWADGAGSGAGVDEVARQQITALSVKYAR